MALIIDNLCLSIADKTILKNVSLQCQAGEFVALCGPNGTGKSTIIKAISAELPFQQGRININGKSPQDMSARELALSRAVLPQQVELAFAFSVKEVIDMALLFTANEKKKAYILDQVIELLALQDFSQRNYNSLSGGEKQRVQLARVIAQLMQEDSVGERYLLVDECTSAMDMAWMHRAFAILKQQKQHNIGIIAVVHDLNLASLYADKLVLLDKQHQVYSGSPQTILQASLIEQVFSAPVSVIEHPEHASPVVIASPF